MSHDLGPKHLLTATFDYKLGVVEAKLEHYDKATQVNVPITHFAQRSCPDKRPGSGCRVLSLSWRATKPKATLLEFSANKPS